MPEPTMTLEGVAADLRRLGYQGYAAAIDAAIAERAQLEAVQQAAVGWRFRVAELEIVVSEITAERDALLARIESAPAGELRASLGKVELRDVDAEAMALDGQRVRLVVEDNDD